MIKTIETSVRTLVNEGKSGAIELHLKEGYNESSIGWATFKSVLKELNAPSYIFKSLGDGTVTPKTPDQWEWLESIDGKQLECGKTIKIKLSSQDIDVAKYWFDGTFSDGVTALSLRGRFE